MPTTQDFWQGAFFGFAGGSLLVCVVCFTVAAKFLRKNDIYDADHWKLNVKVPFTTMWMNMGYWASSTGQPIDDFEQACRNLLHQVIASSSILQKGNPSSKLSILDLGIGCGDQTWELARLTRQSGWKEYRYVGLTLNVTQFHLASAKAEQESQGSSPAYRSINVFQADAARPESWTPDIQTAVEALGAGHSDEDERWVLGLDSLYHFFPSRKPILRYAAKNLDASFMAFDLVLNEDASFKERLIVKLLSVAMKCPSSAFVTEAEYKRQLQEVGYDAKHVHFRDVTEHVFPGLIRHINRQKEALKPFGISLSKYQVAAKVFGWFTRSKAIRAVIVAAHKKPKMT